MGFQVAQIGLGIMRVEAKISVTNSSSGLIFVKIRAESGQIFSKNPGKIQAKIQATY